MEDIERVMSLYKQKWQLLLHELDFHELTSAGFLDANTFYLSVGVEQPIPTDADFLVGFLNMSGSHPLDLTWRVGSEDFTIKLIPNEFRAALSSEPLWIAACRKDQIEIIRASHNKVGIVYLRDAVQLPTSLPYWINTDRGDFEYRDGRIHRVDGPRGALCLNIWV